MSGRRCALSPRAALEASPEDGVRVLVDTHSGTLCSCNDSAWTILTALKAGDTVDALTSLVTSIYDVDQIEAREDALDFIHRLAAMGLIDEAE